MLLEQVIKNLKDKLTCFSKVSLLNRKSLGNFMTFTFTHYFFLLVNDKSLKYLLLQASFIVIEAKLVIAYSLNYNNNIQYSKYYGVLVNY